MTSTPTRTAGAVLAALLAVAGASIPASASTAAATCYGGAVQAHYGDALELGPYRATSRCVDINLKLTGGTSAYVNACVKFARTGVCNHWTRVNKGTWQTIATDVLDGTSFTVPLGVPLEGDSATVLIAF